METQKKEHLFTHLDELLKQVPVQKASSDQKYVVFSDMHMGNGTPRDDFNKNAPLFKRVLRDYYLKKNYTLILNGDIEELQKFTLESVLKNWKDIYHLFKKFSKKNALIKIIGNHDQRLAEAATYPLKDVLQEGLILEFKGDRVFIFHGHQASLYFKKYNQFSGFILRYLAYPLGIKNRSPAYDSKKRFGIEKMVYEFSNRNKIISVIGHTHRPLFESLSKLDYFKYQIEVLCREYPTAKKSAKKNIRVKIDSYREELDAIHSKEKNDILAYNIYNTDIIIPSLFNSGCAIGKRGITSIEILDNQILLVHWFDKKRRHKHIYDLDSEPVSLKKSNTYRTILKKDHLDYIFARIHLLA